MGREAYIEKGFSEYNLGLLLEINRILDEYREAGYVLTVRQLYYQLVAHDLIPNDQRSYKRIIDLVSNGRLAGLIDWDMITDRARHTVWAPHWSHPANAVRTVQRVFQIDKWADQECYVEVICEKDALSGVLEDVCAELDIRYTAARGYMSLSIVREIAQRFWRASAHDKHCVLVYLGDHDPSGLDMIRDIDERLQMFHDGEDLVAITHAALTMEQIETLNPPENPAKISDSRFRNYALEHGYSSWELDAIPPDILTEIVTQAVLSYREEDRWADAVDRQNAMSDQLTRVIERLEEN